MSSPTRAAIAHAARRRFARDGYTATSVRSVAADAGIDAALVIRHFGSKEQLFLETVAFQGLFTDVLAGPLDGLGARLVAAVASGRDGELFAPYRVLMRATDSERVRLRLLEAMEAMFVAPLAPRLPGPQPDLRARLVAAQVSGLLDLLVILEEPQVLATPPADLAAAYGRAIQTLVDAPG